MPTQLSEGHRQRLLELQKQVARVQALGDEYHRVCLGEQATQALEEVAVG
jgi:hypothetical protein